MSLTFVLTYRFFEILRYKFQIYLKPGVDAQKTCVHYETVSAVNKSKQ